MFIWLATVGVFGLFVIGTFYSYHVIFGERIKMTKRVDEVVKAPAPLPIRQQELSAPLYQRAIKPLLAGLTRVLARGIPATREVELEKKLAEAGNPGNLTPKELMTTKYLFSFGATALLWFLAASAGKNLIQGVLLTLAGIPLGWLLPDFYLSTRTRQRKEEVAKTLPDVLDLLTVSVEAGLGFDGALMKVVEKSKGALAEAFLQVLQEAKMGKPRREGLRDMANRLAVDELSNFAGSVILADQLGLSIGKVLRVQAKDMRQKRRQRSEEQAMKAPVKMLLPIVVFIFPALFVILLGPAVIQIMRVFGN